MAITLDSYDRSKLDELARAHGIEPHAEEAVTLYRLAHRGSDYRVSAWAQMHLRKLYREEGLLKR